MFLKNNMGFAQSGDKYSEIGRQAQKALIAFETSGDWKQLNPGIDLFASQPQNVLTTRDLARYAQLVGLRFEQQEKIPNSGSVNDLRLFFDLFRAVQPIDSLFVRDRNMFGDLGSKLLPHLINLGVSQMQNEALGDAEKIFNQAWKAADQLKQAKQWKNASVSVDTVRLTSLNAAAYAAARREDWKSAERYAQEACTQFPELASTLSTLIEAKIKLGNHTEAEHLIRKAKQQFPNNNSWELWELNYLIGLKQWSKSLQKIEKLLLLEPQNKQLYLTKASLLEQEISSISVDQITSAQLDRIENWYRETIRKFPQAEDAWYGLGALFYNRYAQLTSLLAKSPSEDPVLVRKLEDAEKSLVEKALPAFQRVQQINLSDMNSLVALKTIYGLRANSKEYQRVSERLKLLQEGKRPSAPLY